MEPRRGVEFWTLYCWWKRVKWRRKRNAVRGKRIKREIYFGPFFIKVKDVRPLKGFTATGIALEVTSESHVVSPLYLKIEDESEGFSRGAGDFYIHQNDLPCEAFTHGFFLHQVDGFTLVPLDDVLLAVYRSFSAPRPLMEILTDLRGMLPRKAVKPLKFANHLRPEAAQLGFRTEFVFPYGRTLRVDIDWVPPGDISSPSPCSVSVGPVEFTPLPDRTLGLGKWITGRYDRLGLVLREELANRFKGPPIKIFSDAGIKALVAKFPWRPITLLSKKELAQAKAQFVRDHPELHTNLSGMAKEMIKAGLYSEGTQPSSVKKTAAKILASLGSRS